MKTYLTRTLALASTWSLLVMSGYATVIESVPYVIHTPGTYTLDGSVSLAPGGGTAIQVNASNVLIDLKGFTLSATDSTPQSLGILVATGTTHITVQNGSINGFLYGIEMSCTHFVVQDLQFFANWYAINARASGSGKGLIQNCFVDGAGYQTAGFILGCNENVVKNNQILNFYGPNGVGVLSNGGNLFIGNSIFNCGIGLVLGSSDKYQSNLTVFCGTPFSGGTAVGDDNN